MHFGCQLRLADLVAIEHASALLERRDDSRRRHGAALAVLSVCSRVTDHGLDEALQDATHFLVEEAGQALDARSARKPADGSLGDATYVGTQNLLDAFVGNALGFAGLLSLSLGHC